MLAEPLAVTIQVTTVLDELGAPYLVGGSLAGAIHGLVRTTQDADLVVDMRDEHALPFAKAVQDEFYVDINVIYSAIRHQSSFNIIHLRTMFKVDVFIAKQRAFDKSQFKRRVARNITPDASQSIYIATAEDTILAKLEWYRLGEEVSERQWRDVLGIIKVQDARLDVAYLQRWAAELGVADLLEKALNDAQSPRR